MLNWPNWTLFNMGSHITQCFTCVYKKASVCPPLKANNPTGILMQHYVTACIYIEMCPKHWYFIIQGSHSEAVNTSFLHVTRLKWVQKKMNFTIKNLPDKNQFQIKIHAWAFSSWPCVLSAASQMSAGARRTNSSRSSLRLMQTQDLLKQQSTCRSFLSGCICNADTEKWSRDTAPSRINYNQNHKKKKTLYVVYKLRDVLFICARLLKVTFLLKQHFLLMSSVIYYQFTAMKGGW